MARNRLYIDNMKLTYKDGFYVFSSPYPTYILLKHNHSKNFDSNDRPPFTFVLANMLPSQRHWAHTSQPSPSRRKEEHQNWPEVDTVWRTKVISARRWALIIPSGGYSHQSLISRGLRLTSCHSIRLAFFSHTNERTSLAFRRWRTFNIMIFLFCFCSAASMYVDSLPRRHNECDWLLKNTSFNTWIISQNHPQIQNKYAQMTDTTMQYENALNY